MKINENLYATYLNRVYAKYGIVYLIENKRTEVPVSIANSFNMEYGRKYPSFLFDDNAFQTTTTGVAT